MHATNVISLGIHIHAFTPFYGFYLILHRTVFASTLQDDINLLDSSYESRLYSLLKRYNYCRYNRGIRGTTSGSRGTIIIPFKSRDRYLENQYHLFRDIVIHPG